MDMVIEKFSNVEDENLIGKFDKLRQKNIMKKYVKELVSLSPSC